jgi:hypothetical protein
MILSNSIVQDKTMYTQKELDATEDIKFLNLCISRFNKILIVKNTIEI